MIQRIQSIYLLIVVFLNGLLFFLPIASFSTNLEETPFTVCGVSGMLTWPLLLLNLISLGLALATICLYKKRMLQIRLCVFNAILEFGFYLLSAYYLYKLDSDNIYLNLKFAIIFPFINVILNYLALRAIGKDEALIRSIDHLR